MIFFIEFPLQQFSGQLRGQIRDLALHVILSLFPFQDRVSFRLAAKLSGLFPGLRHDLVAPVFRHTGRVGNDLSGSLLRSSHGRFVIQAAFLRFGARGGSLLVIRVNRGTAGVHYLLYRFEEKPLHDPRNDKQIGQGGQDRPYIDGNHIQGCVNCRLHVVPRSIA